MKYIYQNSKKSFYFIILSITLILVMIIGITMAYFKIQSSSNVIKDVRLYSSTTDLLTFEIDNEININVNQSNFYSGGNNIFGETYARAILTPNNNTGEAQEYYYMYINIDKNEIDYSSTNINRQPELLLTLSKDVWCIYVPEYDENSCDYDIYFENESDCINNDFVDSDMEFICETQNKTIPIDNLGVPRTINGVTGYDITRVSGIIPIVEYYGITATNGNAVSQEWKIMISLVNLDVVQNDNTGKIVEASIILSKENVMTNFNGVLYKPKAVLENESSLVNVGIYNGLEIETNPGWCIYNSITKSRYNCYDNMMECNNYLNLNNHDANVYCRFFNRIQIDPFVYAWNGGTGYCVEVSSYSYNSCDSLNYEYIYDSEEECSNAIQHGLSNTNFTPRNSTCVQKEYGQYYLKYYVEDNIIEKTESCLLYQNREFCFEQNYWVETGNGGTSHESEENGLATLNKLRLDMQSKFGVVSDECYNDTGSAGCYYGDRHCIVESSGYVGCGINKHEFGVKSDGVSTFFTR